MPRYFEDLSVGETWTAPPVSVTREDIVAFARQFDPQSFHVDDEAGSRHFDGVIASGWHTAALCQRPFAETVLSAVAVVAAQGIDDLRWHAPLQPGDELTVAVEITEKRPWSEERGRVTFSLSAENQDGVRVHSRKDLVVVERREPVSSGSESP